MKEPKVGEVLEHEGIKLEVVENSSCKGCYFKYGRKCKAKIKYAAFCSAVFRKSSGSIIYKKVKQ